MGLTSCLLLGFVAALGLTGAMCNWASVLGLIDQPNSRSSHVHPTPRGGGVAIAAVVVAAIAWLSLVGRVSGSTSAALLVGGLMMTATGLADDRVGLPAGLRLAIQIVCVVGVVQSIQLPLGIELGNWSVSAGAVASAVAIVCLVWLINLFNFMDGIDGIAAAEAIFVSGAGAVSIYFAASEPGEQVTGNLLAMVAAASLGFLCWNWSPARIFMGDAGSSFLGFFLGSLALYTVSIGQFRPAQWLVLWGAFLADATVTIVRRILRRERPDHAHRSHAYQHLARRFGHAPTTLFFAGVNVCWLLPWFIYVRRFPESEAWGVSIALIPLFVASWVLGSGMPGSDDQ